MAGVMAVCAEVMDRPWQWGGFGGDCCTASCDVFNILFGIDPMASLRGRYSTQIGAARIIRRMGGWLDMADELATRAGLFQVATSFEGNIGVIRDARGQMALGICVGGGMWAGKTDRGFATVPDAVRAYTCRQ